MLARGNHARKSESRQTSTKQFPALNSLLPIKDTYRFCAIKIEHAKKVLFLCFLILIELFLLSSGTPAYGLDPAKHISQYVHVVWTVKNGLPVDTIKTICQHRKGYIWTGTSEGLVRFDGIKFKVFNTSNTSQLKSNDIIALKEDSSGNLWIGTNGGGLTKFINGDFVNYSQKNGLPSSIVLSLCEDRNDNLWIGTDSGLVRFKEDKFITFTEKDGLSSNIITALLEDKKGTLWIGTIGGGLTSFKNGRFAYVPMIKNRNNRNSVRSLWEDRNGNLWIGTVGNGLVRLKNEKLSVYTTDHGLSNNSIFSIFEDRDGNLWVGTNGGGLNRFRNEKFTVFSQGENFFYDVIRAIYEDEEGNLWVGTRGNGLSRINDGKFTTYTENEGLSNNFIRCVYEDSSGRLWVGTNSGVNLFKDGQFIPFAENYLSKIPAFSILIDKDDNMWIAAIGRGLYRLRNNLLKIYSEEDGLKNNLLQALLFDHEGSLWIGTFGGGLYRFENERFIHYSIKDGLYSDIIYYIYEDHKKNLWVGTGIGLNCIKEGNIVSYPFENSLSKEVVYSIHEDEELNLWLGTSSGGLKKVNENELKTYSSNDGLFSDRIFGILEDHRGDLWMSCGKGVFSVQKKDLDDYDSGKIKKIPVKAFDESDGMHTRECHGTDSQVACKTKDGKLWFATLKGLSMIDPAHIEINKHPPKVFIENVVIGGEIFSPDQEIKIHRGGKSVTFHFNSLSLTAPEKVKFRYELEGFENKWNNVGVSEERTAYYARLSPGFYRFRVKAFNNDNVWSDKEAVYEFRLRPYFHQTYLFYALCISTAVLVGYGLWQIYRLKLKIRELKKYKSSSLQTMKVEEYIEKLVQMMEEKKYFADQEMSLPKLASILSIPPPHLSQIINVHLKQNFSDFINSYRVKEAKKKLLNPEYKHFKLTAIGHDVGFKSTSAFYSAFKKCAGTTPLGFKKKHENKEDS